MQNLDHEQFEGAKVLADIGVKIAAGRAALAELKVSKEDFLTDREAEAIARVNEALTQAKETIVEIGKYHDELKGYSTQVSAFYADVLSLIQSVESCKEAFDEKNRAELAEIKVKMDENTVILSQIQSARSLLAGESEAIAIKRRNLNAQDAKIKDEWTTIAAVKKELKIK